MFADLTPQQIVYFIILLSAFAVLLTEKLRTDVVAILIILALALTRTLSPEEALRGFSSEPAIVVAGIFVLSAGLHQTGLSELFGRWIGRWAGSSFSRAVLVIMPAVAVLSAFTHHLTTTAVMLPVTMNLSREKGIAPSKLLMPLSFAASLGTTITIIGAPAFLIASGILQQAGRPGLSVFSIAPIGIALSIAGTIFTVLLGRFLLPERTGSEDAANRFRLEDYVTELTILPDSPFRGKTIQALQADERYQFDVLGWLRGGNRVERPYGEQPLAEGDVLVVRTTPDEIVAFRQESGVELHPVAQYNDDVPAAAGEGDVAEQLVQVVVAPGADLLGRTLAEIDFRRRYGAIVVSIWRRRGGPVTELSKVRLRAGDVLVIQGDEGALDRLGADRNFLMMMPFQGEARLPRKAPIAGLIMLGTILAAVFNVLTIEVAALAGAVAMVLARCLTPRLAYRAIDQRIYVFIAGAIPLGLAMQQTGAADLMGNWLQAAIGGWSQWLILALLFALIAVLTQFMSDSATTAIFAPVAVALATALGQAPEAYVVTVAMASVASFLTPIGHHGNLLIYGPGRYQFADFVKVGTPLTVLVGVIVVLMAPLLWPTA